MITNTDSWQNKSVTSGMLSFFDLSSVIKTISKYAQGKLAPYLTYQDTYMNIFLLFNYNTYQKLLQHQNILHLKPSQMLHYTLKWVFTASLQHLFHHFPDYQQLLILPLLHHNLWHPDSLHHPCLLLLLQVSSALISELELSTVSLYFNQFAGFSSASRLYNTVLLCTRLSISSTSTDITLASL